MKITLHKQLPNQNTYIDVSKQLLVPHSIFLFSSITEAFNPCSLQVLPGTVKLFNHHFLSWTFVSCLRCYTDMAKEFVLEKKSMFIPGQQMSQCFPRSTPWRYEFTKRYGWFSKATSRTAPDLTPDCLQLSVTWPSARLDKYFKKSCVYSNWNPGDYWGINLCSERLASVLV